MPSRKPTTSQPSLSAASTTARKTALSPGQSPPLVRTPIRGFIFAEAKLQDFFWISHPTCGRPLIVQLPAALHQGCAFSKSVRAAQEHHHQMARINRLHLTVANNFRLTICVQNQTVASTRCAACFHSVDAIL